VLAGMPYIFVNGALAFLDSFGTFWAILSIWYYIVYMRNHQRFRNWVILGGIMAIAVLGKQSNIIIIPLFLCVTVLFPSRLPAKTLFLSMTCAVISGSITLCIFTNPFAFYEEISRETAPIMAAKQPGFSQEKPAETWIVRSFEKAIQNFTLPFRPKQNYHFGMVRHKGRPFVKNPIIVQAYEITTPSAAAIVCLCCILLVLRRKYAAWPLIACLLVFIAVVPLGNILRRLYILVPYATLIVAFGIAEISHIKTMGWRLRR
jgi:4-amino-4-deoxy-L-arabinose transferase-like glycosyltransferase